MIQAYINYPNPHVSVHTDPACGSIHAQHKPSQRIIRISLETLSEELRAFKDKQYPFSASAERNDMWLEVDFHDLDFEMAVVGFVVRVLGQQYQPFSDVKPVIHC